MPILVNRDNARVWVLWQGDPTTCGFIRSELQYESYLRKLDVQRARWKRDCGEVEAAAAAAEESKDGEEIDGQSGEVKAQIEQMKLQIDSALGEIAKLQMQMGELKTSIMGALVVPVVCVCVGIVLVLTMLWK